MKLKALEVQGFKTFPDKTRLDFTDGITAVVGPNGSGKSNISDAIRWVLGEQSAKSLRCSKMEDVIFNGTRQRKKTGYAQVTLSVDNSDRALRYDGDEVSVTRRFYRSGNSEYLINNAAVRLQDIHELFMDTGLGRDGYSMIGQGKIDSIVSTKSEDRREIFEEAAGISRFRYKKADAEKRLDKTEENLVRLRDIMSELEGRVEPLRIQSEKAKSYLEYAEEKRSLEIALWLKTLEKSSASIREQDDRISAARTQYEDTEEALRRITAESEKIFSEQNNFTARADTIRGEISSNDEQSADKKSQISVLRNDILHNKQTIERINFENDSIIKSGDEIYREIEEKKNIIKENTIRLEEHRKALEKYTEELESIKSRESMSSEKIDEINAVVAEFTEKMSDAKIRYMTSSSSSDELTGRIDIIENTLKARSSQTQTLKNIISDYNKMRNDCIENIDKLNSEIREIQITAEKKSNECDELKVRTDKFRLDSEQLFRKAKILEELERNLEGFTRSVKIIMREAKKGVLKGIHGPVSRVIKTPAKYSTAVEIALGAAMQNIVTESDSDAKQAIAYLKKNDGGRATFLPISIIKGRELNERNLESCDGFVGIASKLCSCDECYKDILSNLLGRIVIAKDIDCAAEIAKKYSYRFRVVTLDGQVVNSGGSLTGGSLAKNAGLLGRAAEIEKITDDARRLSDLAKREESNYNTSRSELEKIIGSLNTLKERLSVMTEDKIKIEAEIKSRTTELNNTEKSLDEIQREHEESMLRLEELKTLMENSHREIEEYNEKIKENEDIVQTLAGSRNDFVLRRESVAEKIQELRIKVLTLEKDISSAENEIESAGIRIDSSGEKIRLNKKEISELTSKNESTDKKIEQLEKDIECIAERNTELRQAIEKFNNEKMLLEKRASELRQNEREKISERENINGELARLEERRSGLQNQYDEIVGKLWEEYELTKREAESTAIEIDDTGKARRRLAELKQKIKALGSVNVSAIDEYKEVKERYEFLKVQIGDVEKSKSELLRLIGDLTKQMHEIFVERFNLINQNFSSTFVELFGGGKASLSLTDPENILTSGIEISVEPPGKLVSHIELLSGGEKALVAISLYFAIMKVSPAPFCVMDEIEAALDDVNVYRFAAYLRRMNDKTQFICITHRRGTMEEADVLYGVTMQDRGISKLLELRASEVEQKLGLKA